MIKKLMPATVSCVLAVALTLSALALEGEQAEKLYRQGQDALNGGRYDAALESFGQLVDEGQGQGDRALYWQAYTFNKLGRKNEARNALRRMIRDFPDSPWRDDAEALQIEISGAKTGESLDRVDDDLKLYALDALHHVEPERAVDLLEEFLLGDHSTKLKEHALFILAQTGSERASMILLDAARGNQGDTLQRHAIQALGIVGEASARKTLVELYQSSSDRATKEAIIHSMVAADADAELASLVKQEKDPALVEAGLHVLGAMGARDELRAFAKSLPARHLPAVLHGLGVANDVDGILSVLDSTSDDSVIEVAIHSLAIADRGGDDRIAKELARLYESASSRQVKSMVIQAFMIQGDAEALLRIFRQEQDGELKREVLRALANVDSPEADKLIEDLLKG